MTFVLVVMAFLVAGYIMMRIRPNGPLSVIWSISGYVVGFVLVITIINNVLPGYFVSSMPSFEENWAPVWDEAAGTGNGAIEAINSAVGLDIPHLPGEELVEVQTPAMPVVVADVVLPTATMQPTPSPIASPVATITATIMQAVITPIAFVATPTPAVLPAYYGVLPTYYNDLLAAEANGDRLAGRAAIASIFVVDLNDPTATQAQFEIDTAELRLLKYSQLAGIPTSWRIDLTRQQQVFNALLGGTYRVVAVNDEGWLSCGKVATVQDITPGWTYSATFQVVRCYLSQWRAEDVGSVFTVEP